MRWWDQIWLRQRPPGGTLPPGYAPPPRVLGGWGLTAMGIGATIGAGIFVTAGQEARAAGPGVVLAFAIAGVACALAGLCYAEFAALAPTGGSAYSYAYSTLGELLAWVIGWDLVLEYTFASSIVAVEWGLNLFALLQAVGLDPPRWLVGPVNLLAVLVVAAVAAVLYRGVEESARANAVMVAVKVGVVLLAILFGAWLVDPANWVNPPEAPPGFLPNGFGPVMTAAGVVFFSYIGFDAVSTHAEETRDPGRNLPLGILGSLAVCTLLYVGVAVVLVGMVPWPRMAPQAPVVNAFVQQGGWLARAAGVVIGVGAVAGMTSVILVTLSGQARIFRAMARDGLLPRRVFAAEHPRHRSPHRSIVLIGLVGAAVGAFTPADELLEMVAIGTLLAFALVCAAVLVLRRTNPEFHRPFRCPAVHLVAPLGIAANLAMMFSLKPDAWVRLGAWLAVGLVVYFAYGRLHSEARRLEAVAPGGVGPGGVSPG